MVEKSFFQLYKPNRNAPWIERTRKSSCIFFDWLNRLQCTLTNDIDIWVENCTWIFIISQNVRKINRANSYASKQIIAKIQSILIATEIAAIIQSLSYQRDLVMIWIFKFLIFLFYYVAVTVFLVYLYINNAINFFELNVFSSSFPSVKHNYDVIIGKLKTCKWIVIEYFGN